MRHANLNPRDPAHPRRVAIVIANPAVAGEAIAKVLLEALGR